MMKSSTARALRIQQEGIRILNLNDPFAIEPSSDMTEPFLPTKLPEDEDVENEIQAPPQTPSFYFDDVTTQQPEHPHNACLDTLEEMLDPCGADKDQTTGIKKGLKQLGRVFCLCCCLFKCGESAYRYKEAEKKREEFLNNQGPRSQTM
jgi:hypothetical protein